MNNTSTLILTTNNFTLVNYLGESSSTLDISDSCNVFNIYELSNTNTLDINTLSDIDISDYIKKNQDTINITSASSIKIDFSDNISETISLSDNTSIIKDTHGYSEDEIILRTKSKISVDYTPEESSDTIIFTDICDLLTIISNKKVFKNAIHSLIGNSNTTVYTCNAKESTIINISLCNRTLNDIKIDISINNSSGITYLGKEILIKPHQTFLINNNEDNNIQLLNGDSITIQSDTLSSTDVLISVLETI